MNKIIVLLLFSWGEAMPSGIFLSLYQTEPTSWFSSRFPRIIPEIDETATTTSTASGYSLLDEVVQKPASIIEQITTSSLLFNISSMDFSCLSYCMRYFWPNAPQGNQPNAESSQT